MTSHDHHALGRRAESANGNGLDRTRTARAVEWLLGVLAQGLAISAVVGAILLALIKPQIEAWIDLKVAAEASTRSSYDQMIERWRIDHERWSAEKSKELESGITLEREMRLRQDAEILRLRDRMENGRSTSGRGGGS